MKSRILPFALVGAACANPSTLSSQDPGWTDLQDQRLGARVSVREYAGDRLVQGLQSQGGRTKVDSRSQIFVEVGADVPLRELRELTDQVDEYLADLGTQIRQRRALHDRLRAGVVSARDVLSLAEAERRARSTSIHVDRDELDALATEAAGMAEASVEIHATKGDGTPLAVANWTEGENETEGSQSIAAQIDRLVDELQAKVQEVDAAERESQRAAEALEDARQDTRDSVRREAFTEGSREELAMHDFFAEVQHEDVPDPGVDSERTLEGAKQLTRIRRSLAGFLPPGRLELALADVERRDQIDLSVDVLRPVDGGDDELLASRQYLMELDDFGWRGHVRPQLIFYRSTDGDSDEKTFQTNAAALVEWAYRYREPETLGHRFVNAFEPAIGIHLASLDQGDSSLEVGTGLNLSFKEGLVSVGWGYNLSERDHYYFVGGNLFQLYDKLSSVVGE